MKQMKCDDLWLIAKKYGTPIYIYDLLDVNERISYVKNTLKNIEVAYCLKANPNFELCKFISKQLKTCEVSSSGELKIAKRSGFDIEKSVFTGPGKTFEEIKLGISLGIGAFVVESFEELSMIEKICNKYNKNQDVIIRINTGGWEAHTHERMVGSTKFGLNYEYLISHLKNKIYNYNHCNIVGLHVYEASEIMDYISKVKSTKYFLKMVKDFEEKTKFEISLIDIGGGYGINYTKKSENFDFKSYWNLIKDDIRELKNKNIRILTEIGRYIVARCGHYIIKTLYIKKNDNNNFIIVNGGINHFIRHIITKDKHLIVSQKKGSNKKKQFRVCGNLCTPIDEFGTVSLSTAPSIGDFFSIEDVGAYGFSLSPLLFLSHSLPKEIILYPNGHTIVSKSIFNESNG